MADPTFTCPYCEHVHHPFGVHGDPHEQIDELLDDRGPTVVTCDDCGRSLVVQSTAVWSFAVDCDETDFIQEVSDAG